MCGGSGHGPHGRRTVDSSSALGSEAYRRAAAVVGPVDGAGNLPSRHVGGMRQVRWVGSDQPRISAPRVGSPANARGAPLQGPTTGAALRHEAAASVSPLPLESPAGAGLDPARGRPARIGYLWSGASEATVGEPTRSGENRGRSGMLQRICRIRPTDRERRFPAPRQFGDPGRSPARRTDSSASRILSPSRAAARAPRARPTPAALDEPAARRSTTRSRPSDVRGR